MKSGLTVIRNSLSLVFLAHLLTISTASFATLPPFTICQLDSSGAIFITWDPIGDELLIQSLECYANIPKGTAILHHHGCFPSPQRNTFGIGLRGGVKLNFREYVALIKSLNADGFNRFYLDGCYTGCKGGINNISVVQGVARECGPGVTVAGNTGQAIWRLTPNGRLVRIVVPGDPCKALQVVENRANGSSVLFQRPVSYMIPEMPKCSLSKSRPLVGQVPDVVPLPDTLERISNTACKKILALPNFDSQSTCQNKATSVSTAPVAQCMANETTLTQEFCGQANSALRAVPIAVWWEACGKAVDMQLAQDREAGYWNQVTQNNRTQALQRLTPAQRESLLFLGDGLKTQEEAAQYCKDHGGFLPTEEQWNLIPYNPDFQGEEFWLSNQISCDTCKAGRPINCYGMKSGNEATTVRFDDQGNAVYVYNPKVRGFWFKKDTKHAFVCIKYFKVSDLQKSQK